MHRVAGCVLAYSAMSSCMYVGELGSLEVWAQGTLNRMCKGVSSLVNTVRSMRLALDLLSTGGNNAQTWTMTGLISIEAFQQK